MRICLKCIDYEPITRFNGYCCYWNCCVDDDEICRDYLSFSGNYIENW